MQGPDICSLFGQLQKLKSFKKHFEYLIRLKALFNKLKNIIYLPWTFYKQGVHYHNHVSSSVRFFFLKYTQEITKINGSYYLIHAIFYQFLNAFIAKSNVTLLRSNRNILQFVRIKMPKLNAKKSSQRLCFGLENRFYL